MKNKLALSFVTLGGCIIATLTFFWIIIECIAKWLFDHEFNWWCIWIFLASIILIIVSSTFFSKTPKDVGNSTTMEEQNKQMAFDFQKKIALPERLSTKSDFESVLNYFLSNSWKMDAKFFNDRPNFPKVLIECTDPTKKYQFEELKRYIEDQKAVFIQVDYVELIVKK